MEAYQLISRKRCCIKYDRDASDLPAKVVEEIFSRVDAEDLWSLIAAGERMPFLLSSKSFIFNHMQQMKSHNRPIYIFQKVLCFFPLFYDADGVRDIEVSRLVVERESGIEILGAVGSLVLYCTEADDFFLLNPITDVKKHLPKCEFLKIDDSTWTHVLFGLGYSDEDQDYKIVRLAIFNTTEFKTQVMVYSKNSGKWSRAPDFPIDHPKCQPGVFVCGRIHWLSSPLSPKACIISYNLKEGTYSLMDIPEIPPAYSEQRIVSLDDETLALSWSINKETLSHTIWILKEYSNYNSWKKVEMKIKGTEQDDFTFSIQPLYLIRPSRSELLIRINPSGYFGIYDMRTKVFHELEADYVVKDHTMFHRFVPSFHSPYTEGELKMR